jgi:hypothetical protein
MTTPCKHWFEGMVARSETVCPFCRIDELEAQVAQYKADADNRWNSVQVCSWIGNQLLHEPSMFERGEVCKYVRSLGRDPRLVKAIQGDAK